MSLKFPVSLVGKRISNWLGFGHNSRSFDGVDDYISIPDNPSLPTGAQTICVWVKTEDLGNYGDIVSHWDNSGNASFVILKLQDNQVAFYISQSGNSNDARFTQTGAGTKLSVGVWHHVACVFDPSTSMKIYIDGTLASTNSTNIFSSIYNSSQDLLIGERIDITNRNWHGNIADVRIYDADIGASNITDLSNGINYQTNLVGHWLKDKEDVIDHSVNTNDGDNAYEPEFSLDGPLPSATVFGKYSRDFNGVNDVVDLGNTNARGAAFTACAWVKADTFDPSFGNAILSRWNGNFTNGRNWLLWVSFVDLQKPEFRISDSSNNVIVCSAPSKIVLGQWTHVAGVIDGTNMHLYVDGVLVNTTAFDGTVSTSVTTTTAIGAMNYPNTTAHNFDGNICDCRVYDTALTALQIADLEAGTDVQTNLVGHWLRNENNLLDYAGSNNGSHAGSQYDQFDGPAS